MGQRDSQGLDLRSSTQEEVKMITEGDLLVHVGVFDVVAHIQAMCSIQSAHPRHGITTNCKPKLLHVPTITRNYQQEAFLLWMYQTH